MPNKPPPEGFEAIAATAAAAGGGAEHLETAERVAALEKQFATIEPLLEQLQANSLIGPELKKYTTDLRAEQVFFNRARYVVGGLAFVAIVLLIGLLCVAIFDEDSPMLDAPPVAIAVFVVGVVSGIVVLINGFTKGVFRSTAERHSDGFLPPAFDKVIDALNKMTGKD